MVDCHGFYYVEDSKSYELLADRFDTVYDAYDYCQDLEWVVIN